MMNNKIKNNISIKIIDKYKNYPWNWSILAERLPWDVIKNYNYNWNYIDEHLELCSYRGNFHFHNYYIHQ